MEQANHDCARPYTALAYAEPSRARSIEASSSCKCFRSFANKGPINGIECFLNSMRVEEASDEQGRGITWLELYILYRARGGSKPIPDPEHCAHARATADKQLAAFKRHTRGLIARILDDDGDAK